jgi:hypothetical protein
VGPPWQLTRSVVQKSCTLVWRFGPSSSISWQLRGSSRRSPMRATGAFFDRNDRSSGERKSCSRNAQCHPDQIVSKGIMGGDRPTALTCSISVIFRLPTSTQSSHRVLRQLALICRQKHWRICCDQQQTAFQIGRSFQPFPGVGE